MTPNLSEFDLVQQRINFKNDFSMTMSGISPVFFSYEPKILCISVIIKPIENHRIIKTNSLNEGLIYVKLNKLKQK